jgi:hypothetical protein
VREEWHSAKIILGRSVDDYKQGTECGQGINLTGFKGSARDTLMLCHFCPQALKQLNEFILSQFNSNLLNRTTRNETFLG